ncbi:hypothetical protein AYM40_05970 [Paraburkholderia phytofirmans OLGA172]|uniref:Uncharacterized protein n=1 Tax=Paraburkholderia phytofirmans OLGA172 TaxID=1417228 RepID=A0A160FID1_9BURK|nr:hypothetical protein [Paraburkholderia phytofirmans]ANB71971.1 hypothetical protein AYM40_05970 [Paraburkholderia phytofirmans OLGA172]
MKSRQNVLGSGEAGFHSLDDMPDCMSRAAPAGPLIGSVRSMCQRLGAAGWREMLLDVTGGAFDMMAPDLEAELVKPLPWIERRFAGFGDFAAAGCAAIQPGQPDFSLLYHALAAPSVVTGRDGESLGAYPTLAEIDTLENYIFAARRVSLSELRAECGAWPIAVSTFATHYRNAPMGVNGRRAQLCFSRAGVARIGNLEPRYEPMLRGFVGFDESRPFDFRVVPRRFSTYLAVRRPVDPNGPAQFGPQDRLDDDDRRHFWVPVHKLFSGPECIVGMDLQVTLRCRLQNDTLAAFHRFLDAQGLENNWSGDCLEEFPFTIRNEMIGSLTMEAQHGPGVLVPRPSTMVEEARYRGARLTFPVDPRYSGKPGSFLLSSLLVLPGAQPLRSPQYLDDAEQMTARPAPQFINLRHRVRDDRIDNLNDEPGLMEIVARGNYEAQHYVDFSGDGWVASACPELACQGIVASTPAFAMIGLPDFLPKLSQRDLMVWWRNDVPAPLRDALWAVPPLALSQTRIAGNIELEGGLFRIDDDTVSAIVSMPQRMDDAPESATRQTANGAIRFDKVGLPDGSPGVFDPGWDASMGVRLSADGTLKRFLVGHGLGSPFIEDVKLCAALGAYWPGVAPDATRQYQPDKELCGISYPWPSAVPLTDEELGMVPSTEGPMKNRFVPWDGVSGPRRGSFQGRPVIEYEDERRVDHIDLQGRMTALLTSRIDLADFQARVLAMAAVYWSLGVRPQPGAPGDVNRVLWEKAQWAVFSFIAVLPDDPDFVRIAAQTGADLDPARRSYRFEMFRWGRRHADPGSVRKVLVDIEEEATAYSDGRVVLINRGGSWRLDDTIPM